MAIMLALFGENCLNKVVCAIEINDGICVRVCSKISNSKIRIEGNKLLNKVVSAEFIAPIIFHRPAKCYRLINTSYSLF